MIVLVSVLHVINSSDFIKSNVEYTLTDCEDYIIDVDEEKESNILPPGKDFDG